MKEKLRAVFNRLKKISFYKKRLFYVILTVLFTLIVIADLAVCFFVPSQNAAYGNRQEMNGGGMEMPDSSGDGFTMDNDAMQFSDMQENEDIGADFEENGMNRDEENEESGFLPGADGFEAGFTDDDLAAVGEMQQSSGFFQTVKAHWLIILIVALALDAASIFMIVRLTIQQKKAEYEAQAELLSDGEVHIARPKKKKKTPPLLWLIPVAGIVLLIMILKIMTAQSTSGAAQTEASILSGSAETGDISTVLPGAGTLEEQDAVSVSLPSEVEILEWYVSNGDTVTEGEVLALVDEVSVMSAIATVQENLTALDEEIAEHEDDEIADTITAATSGRVKMIYAESGDSVVDTMYESGALMLISIDGLMAVSFETDAQVSVGDSVTVVLSDGTETDGTVESVKSGTVVVTLTDEDVSYQDSVTVTDGDGTQIGSGVLYIHSELSVTAFIGTVSDVNVSVEEEVEAGDTLFTLTDTAYTGDFELLLEQRAQLEEQLTTLFRLYQERYLYADTAGVISGLSDTAVTTASADSADSGSETLYEASAKSSISALPVFLSTATSTGADTVFDSLYVNYVGVIKTVDDGQTVTLMLLPEAYEIEDYGDLSGIEFSVEKMTEEGSFTLSSSVIVMTYENGLQIAASADGVKEGASVILICSTGSSVDDLSPVGIICVSEDAGSGQESGSEDAGTENQEESETSSDGGAGNSPSNEVEESSENQLSDTVSGNDAMSNDASRSDTGSESAAATDVSGADSDADDAGSAPAESTSQSYSVSETTWFSITPQETMTITITIDELDILLLEEGLAASVTLDAFPGQSFEGVVSSIDLSGTNSGGNSKYTAVVTIAREEDMLAGMNASVKITLDTKENVLCIPEMALVEDETGVYVYTSYNEQKDTLGDPVAVTTGISDGETVEILSGLEEGSEYWYSCLDTVNYSSAFSSGTTGLGSFNLFGGSSQQR